MKETMEQANNRRVVKAAVPLVASTLVLAACSGSTSHRETIHREANGIWATKAGPLLGPKALAGELSCLHGSPFDPLASELTYQITLALPPKSTEPTLFRTEALIQGPITLKLMVASAAGKLVTFDPNNAELLPGFGCNVTAVTDITPPSGYTQLPVHAIATVTCESDSKTEMISTNLIRNDLDISPDFCSQ